MEKVADKLKSTNNGNATRRRVKLYQLDAKNQWEDKGTGHVTCTYSEKHQSVCIVVISEKDGESTLIESKIHAFPDDLYQLQQETLIVWNDPETDVDLALSFQEPAGCREVYDQIIMSQKLNGEAPGGEDENGNVLSNGNGTERISLSRDSDVGANGWELPPANITNLGKIYEVISRGQNSPSLKERIVIFIVKEKFITKLLDVFNICEGLENAESLHTLFNIFKSLLLYNDTNLYDVLFSDELIIQLIGVLEYDPEVNVVIPNSTSTTMRNRIPHREYLTKHVVYKEVVPFKNTELVSKIHQTYKIQYIKDVILPRYLDDPTFATLNSILFFNNVEIVSIIQNDEAFLSELFQRLEAEILEEKAKKENKDKEQKSSTVKDLISFIQELCNLAKNLQAQSRLAFYQTLTRYGLCDILDATLSYHDVSIRLTSITIIESMLAFDITSLRRFLLSQKPEYSLFNQIIQRFLYDEDMGIRVQLFDILRSLIDSSDGMSASNALHTQSALTSASSSSLSGNEERSQFVHLFYQDFIQKMVDPVIKDSSDVLDTVKESAINMLSFCVQHHGYMSRTYLLGNNIIAKILKLVKYREKKHLLLSIIRFMRSIVGVKDDYYYRHIIKNNLMEPLIGIFKDNLQKYNLINSAILELLDFIRKENVKNLVQYLVENNKDLFKEVTYVDTLKLLILKNEQNLDTSYNSPTNNSTTSSQSTASLSPSPFSNSRSVERDLEAELEAEEEYYFQDDDSEIPNENKEKESNKENEYIPPILSAADEIDNLPSSIFKPRSPILDVDDDEDSIFSTKNSRPPSTGKRKEEQLDNNSASITPPISKKPKISINLALNIPRTLDTAIQNTNSSTSDSSEANKTDIQSQQENVVNNSFTSSVLSKEKRRDE